MKAAATEPAGAPAAQECPRCAQGLRPDWNFCPTCALPVRPEENVLSSQIRVVRTPAEERAPATSILRWVVPGAALLLVTGTAAVGVVLWSPRAADILTPEAPESPSVPSVTAEYAGITPLEWVRIPAGPFRYGAPSEGRNWTEEVDLAAFEVSRCEVSNDQWMEYLQDRAEDLRSKGKYRAAVPSNWPWRKVAGRRPPDDEEPLLPDGWESLPVRGVTYDQATEYCAWLNQSGHAPGARLPSEDEWEKAARGTDGRVYPWGDTFVVERDVSGRRIEVDGAVVTPPVAVVSETATDKSPFGVLHMGGNVSEWVDLWGRNPGDRPGPWDRVRVIRGASYQDGREDGRIYARTWSNDVQMERGMSALYVGFRVARSVSEEPAPSPGAPVPGGGR